MCFPALISPTFPCMLVEVFSETTIAGGFAHLHAGFGFFSCRCWSLGLFQTIDLAEGASAKDE